MNLCSTASVTVVVVATMFAGVVDVWKFKVHNLLTLPLIVSGLLYHLCCEGTLGFLGSLAGLSFGFAILFVFFLLGGMGLGDVKLMGGVGAWLGLEPTYHVFVASSLAAGFLSLALVLRYGRRREPLSPQPETVVDKLKKPDRRRRVVPFATMIAVGVLILAALGYLTPL